MPPQAAVTQEKSRSNRTTVGLSDETIKRIDALIAEGERKTREVLGYAVSPSRSDLVASLVKQAHDTAKAA